MKKKVSTGVLSRLRGGYILLVEDNEINQLVASEILKGLGLVVMVASSGEQALELVQQWNFNAVLMDIQMPGMDGYEATARIRDVVNPAISNLPVIALTAHALDGDREKTQAAGLNDHITKPIDERKLIEVLIRWVKLDHPDVVFVPVNINKNQSSRLNDNLGSLPGINSATALQRLGGDKTLFTKLLRLFYVDYADYGDRIRKALDSGDLERARRLVHSLKGVAGQLSADVLC